MALRWPLSSYSWAIVVVVIERNVFWCPAGLDPASHPVQTVGTLLLPEDFPLTAGEWELQLSTLFNPSFRHYKIPRTVVHSFTVYG